MTRRGEASRRRRAAHTETPLQRLLDARSIPAAHVLAKLQQRLLDRAPSEKQFGRWRLGRAETNRKNWVRVFWAVREAANDPAIRMEDIVDLDPDNPANWQD